MQNKFLLTLYLFFALFCLTPSTHAQPQENKENIDVEIFYTSHPLPIQTPVQEFFGGGLMALQKGTVIPHALGLLSLFLILLAFRKEIPARLWTYLSLGLISILSVLISLKVSEGWDELFINLRHSYTLSHTGHFSSNLHNMEEGTVDFLPFFLTGILNKFSFPLIETILTITLAGNVLLIVTAWLIAKALTKDSIGSIFCALGIGLFPCVVFVGATGFTAGLFTAAILLCVYLLFISPRDHRGWGMTLLSLLTLIRVEGVAFAFLAWLALYVIGPCRFFLNPQTRVIQIKSAMLNGFILALPFLLSLVIRKISFGYPIPNPVTYKNTFGDPSYFLAGLQQLRLAVEQFQILFFFILSIGPFAYCFVKKLIDRRAAGALLTTALFCFLYFTAGGDWFPIYWNRYMMPFTILFVLLCWCGILIFFEKIASGDNLNDFPSFRKLYNFLKDKKFVSFEALVILLSAMLVILPFVIPCQGSAYQTLLNHLRSSQNRWERIDELGFFGRYLKASTGNQAVIASPEMATVMFFAERDLVDLMGIVNPQIAHSPLNPLLPADLMHRRRFPRTIDMNKPDVICFWGMVRMEKENLTLGDENEIKNAIMQRFMRFQFTPAYTGGFSRMDIAYFRGGSMEHLREIGYHSLIVSAPQASFYYLVHDSIYADHLRRLNQLGFKSFGAAQISCLIRSDLKSRLETTP